MSRKYIQILINSIYVIITLTLVPIATNIATSDLPQQIRDNRNWAWIGIIIFGFIAIVLNIWLNTKNETLSSKGELNDITNDINNAIYTVNHDPLLTKELEKRSTTLDAWKRYADTLVNICRKNHKRIGKQSKGITKNSLKLLERLTIATRKTFLRLNRKQVFIDIAIAAYEVAFEQKWWIYAAEMAYEVARAYHELEKYDDESDQWIKLLKICLGKHGFHGFWINVYDEKETDATTTFNIPNNMNDKEKFFHALMWAAKLYDLKGLHAFHRSSDKEAQTYFDKAQGRAKKLSDQIVYAWIEVHIGDLEDRQGSTTATQRYENALKIASTFDPSSTSHSNNIPDAAARLNDIVHLKLTCYNKLGRLAFVDAGAQPQIAIRWYEKQLNLAEKYGCQDFTALAHKGLAKIYFQGIPQDLQKASQHAIDALNVNKDTNNIFSGSMELNDFISTIIDIMKSSISTNAQSIP